VFLNGFPGGQSLVASVLDCPGERDASAATSVIQNPCASGYEAANRPSFQFRSIQSVGGYRTHSNAPAFSHE
jgi:hypothetical protein